MALRPDYATLAEMRSFVRITDGADTVNDTQLSLAVTAASRAVDEATDRQFGLNGSAVARVFTPTWNASAGRWTVSIDDLMATPTLVKADLNWDGTFETTITDYQMRPFNAAGDSLPWTSILFGWSVVLSPVQGTVQVTANWGWTTVPDTVKNATLLQAERFYKRRDSPFGVAGSPEMGNELRLLAKVDSDVAVMLSSYSRSRYTG